MALTASQDRLPIGGLQAGSVHLAGMGDVTPSPAAHPFASLLRNAGFSDHHTNNTADLLHEAEAAIAEAEAACAANIAAIESALSMTADPATRDALRDAMGQVQGVASMVSSAKGMMGTGTITPTQLADCKLMAATAIATAGSVTTGVATMAKGVGEEKRELISEEMQAQLDAWGKTLDKAQAVLFNKDDDAALRAAMGEEAYEQFAKDRQAREEEIERLKRELARAQTPEEKAAITAQIATLNVEQADENITVKEKNGIDASKDREARDNARTVRTEIARAVENGFVSSKAATAMSEETESILTKARDAKTTENAIVDLGRHADNAAKAADGDTAAIDILESATVTTNDISTPPILIADDPSARSTTVRF